MSLATTAPNCHGGRLYRWRLCFRWPQQQSEVVHIGKYMNMTLTDSLRGRVQCASNSNLRTCRNCKTQFDPLLNHARACRFHTAHFGGETKRKFESVYTGGTMNTADSGKVFEYWHCCGSEDPFDPGCTAAPHCSYDDD